MSSVGELSTTRPLSIGVLLRHGIDFCCGGRRPLSEACAEAGVSVASLLAEVGEAERRAGAPAERWDQAPVGALIAHLRAHFHEPLKRDLETLAGLATKVHAVHGAREPRLERVKAVVLSLRAELLSHLAKEEDILFPWILAPGAPPPEGPVEVMLAEHDDAASALRELVALTDGYEVPDGACRSWAALWLTLARVDRELREHIALENNVLFPRALDGALG